MQQSPTDLFKDDLLYDHKKQEYFGEVIKAIRENPQREMNERAVGYLLYNMSLIGQKDDVVFDLVERFVLKLRG